MCTCETPWMTIYEAAAYLKVDRRTIGRWVLAGRLVKHYPDGELETPRFRREQLDAFMIAYVPRRRTA